MRSALYVRVSTLRQAQTATIEQQLDRLQAYCLAQGWVVPAEHLFRDDGYSGASLHRPGLTHLRDAARRGDLDQVCLTAPDRLARNYAHQVLLIEELAQAGCLVTFLDRPMSADPHDQLVLQIRGAVAEYERSLIAERMQRGRQAKLQTGRLLPWTRPPFGYTVDPSRPRDPAGVRLDAVAAVVVSEIFAYYVAEGHSLSGLAKHLMAHEIRTPNGHWRWNTASLRDMLTNPVYTGALYTGRTRARATQQRHSPLAPVGRRATHNATTQPSEWVVIGQVPAIITAEQFAAVQTKMAQNRQFAARHNTTHRYLLRALVSCGQCQGACFGRTAPGEHPYYVCRGKQPAVQSHHDTRCPARYIRAQDLDALVWADLCALLSAPEALAQALERGQGGAWLPQELHARRENLRSARKSGDQQIERLTDAYVAGIMPVDEYKRRRLALETRQTSLAQQLQQLAAQVDQAHELAGLLSGMEAFAARVRVGLTEATFEQRRQLVELLIDRVVVSGAEVEIRYVIPTSTPSEQVRFCHLRLDYIDPPVTPRQRDQPLRAGFLGRQTRHPVAHALARPPARAPPHRQLEHLRQPRPITVADQRGTHHDRPFFQPSMLLAHHLPRPPAKGRRLLPRA
jgi:site-specific DNA recombinase